MLLLVADVLKRLVVWDEVGFKKQLPLQPGCTSSISFTVHGLSNFLSPAEVHESGAGLSYLFFHLFIHLFINSFNNLFICLCIVYLLYSLHMEGEYILTCSTRRGCLKNLSRVITKSLLSGVKPAIIGSQIHQCQYQ